MNGSQNMKSTGVRYAACAATTVVLKPAHEKQPATSGHSRPVVTPRRRWHQLPNLLRRSSGCCGGPAAPGVLRLMVMSRGISIYILEHSSLHSGGSLRECGYADSARSLVPVLRHLPRQEVKVHQIFRGLF